MKRVALLTLGLGAAISVACGGSSDDSQRYRATYTPIPGCEAHDPKPCNVLDAACQQRLLALTACLRREDVGVMPPVSVMTEAEYALTLSESPSDSTSADDSHHIEVAFGRLGLAKPGSLSAPSLTAERARTTWGLYRWEQKDIVIVDHGVPLDDAFVTPILVHEFVHVLQDRDYDLKTYTEEHRGSFDKYLAARAIVEGEARLHETFYRAAANGLMSADVDWQKRFQGAVERDEEVLRKSDSSYSMSYGTFPYEWGARYMNWVWQKDGLGGALDRFASPPLLTHTYLASVDAALSSEVGAIALEPQAPTSDWRPVASDTLGAWGLFLALMPNTGASDARALALGWRGDSLAVYGSQSSGATLLSWRLELADEATAEGVASWLQRAIAVSAVRVQGTRVNLAWTSNVFPAEDWAFGP